ncbi:MAG: extracellular solute-binding protein [Defluviitaleaceae bacterium]|nr:extracellular solute-binding protein [Defluviitaleaceae bacterium]
MKKWLLLAMLAVFSMFSFTGCACDEDVTTPGGADPIVSGNGDVTPPDEPEVYVPEVVIPEGVTRINVWSFTDEIPNMILRYKEMNPEFAERFLVVPTVVATDGGGYQIALDAALAGGGADAPDLFAAEAAFVVRYTQGDMSSHAMTFSALGIDNVMGRIADADIAQYTVDLGSRDGEVVALAFQHTGSAVIYRRSLAEQVWGNSDPDYVRTRIGPGWDRFFEAAAEMNAANFSMVSGAGDVWFAVRNTGGPWIVNNQLDIHPDRMAFFDFTSKLYNNNWMNDTSSWSGAWFADMAGEGERPVFAFLGPAWLINYVMAGNAGDTYGDWAIAVPPVGFSWGGTWVIPSANMNPDVRDGVRELVEWITLDTSNTGLQYMWAGGTLFADNETKDAVASGVIMAGADGTIPFLGGQDMFDVFIPAGAYADGSLFTQHDEIINAEFEDRAMDYARGDLTREEALDQFRTWVYETLGIN